MNPTPAGDFIPTELPLRYVFLYGDEAVYRSILHQSAASGGGVASVTGRKSGFAFWPASVEGVGGHVFALTTSQFASLDQLFPSNVVRNSVLANIIRSSDGSGGSHSSPSGTSRQPLACSTWISAPLVADGASNHSDTTAEAALHQTGVNGPAPGSKRSLFVTSIGSVTDAVFEDQHVSDASAASGDEEASAAAASSLRESVSSDMRLSFGSDWRTSLPDLDLLPEMMLEQPLPISAVAAASAKASLAAAASSPSMGRNPKPPKQRSHPTKMKKTQEITGTQHAEDVKSMGLLPRGPDGRPKPSSPWIAAAVYWAATSDHDLLNRATGICVAKPPRLAVVSIGEMAPRAEIDASASNQAAGAAVAGATAAAVVETATEFRIVMMGHPTNQAFGREAQIDSGVALVGPLVIILRCCNGTFRILRNFLVLQTRFVLEVMKLAGSNVSAQSNGRRAQQLPSTSHLLSSCRLASAANGL